MFLVELLLPLYRNDGDRQPASLFEEVKEELADRFGGLTAFTRSPAQGVWETDGGDSHDEIVIFEVMADALDRGWWRDYRRRLEARFHQQEIIVRAREVDLL